MNLRLSLNGAKALIAGDPWIAPQAQLSFRLPPEAGTILRVQDMNGDFLGWCVSDGPQGSPAFRVLSRERKVDFGSPWWAAQVEQALAKRRALSLPEGPRRLIHGEADGLPGLVAELSDGVAVLDYRSPGLAAFSDLIEAALIQQARLRGLWRRHALAGGGSSPWHRSALLPKGPARFSVAEPGLPAEADMGADPQGPGLPRPLERRRWRAWAREQAPGRRLLLLGPMAGEAAAAQSAGPAELHLAETGIFKALAKAAALKPHCVLASVPAESKESFGKFDAIKQMPRLLKDLCAACEPGALLLLACDAKPFWHASPWEQAFQEALPERTPALQAVLGPEADFPEMAHWNQGRARKAFVFKVPEQI
jgi:hypothetical protein